MSPAWQAAAGAHLPHVHCLLQPGWAWPWSAALLLLEPPGPEPPLAMQQGQQGQANQHSSASQQQGTSLQQTMLTAMLSVTVVKQAAVMQGTRSRLQVLVPLPLPALMQKA